MNISNLRTVPNGIVFNVDGATPHVQVVGTPVWLQDDNPRSEVRDDNRDYEYEMTYLKSFGEIGEIDRCKNPNDWTEVTGTNFAPKQTVPKLINGPEGSVLMYGPYTIPRV